MRFLRPHFPQRPRWGGEVWRMWLACTYRHKFLSLFYNYNLGFWIFVDGCVYCAQTSHIFHSPKAVGTQRKGTAGMNTRREKAPRKTWRRGNATTTAALMRWIQTPDGREHLDRIHAASRERWKTAPKCGARTKGTGEPCRNIGMENGRCRFHGGRTPKGREWHRVQPAPPGREMEKLETLERRAKQRERRRRKMTPEELERHEAWHLTHKPGSAADRKRQRDALEARARYEAAGIVAKPSEGPPERVTAAAPRSDISAPPVCEPVAAVGALGGARGQRSRRNGR